MGYQAALISLSEALELAVSIAGESRAEIERQFLAALRDGAITASGDHHETRTVMGGEKRGLWDMRAWERQQSTTHGLRVSREQWRAASRADAPTPGGGGSAAASSVDWVGSRVSVQADENTRTLIDNIIVPREELERAFSIVPASSKELIAANASRRDPVLNLASAVRRCEILLADGEIEQAWDQWCRIRPELRARGVRLGGIADAPASPSTDSKGRREPHTRSVAAHAVALRSALRELRRSGFREEVDAAFLIAGSSDTGTTRSSIAITSTDQFEPSMVAEPKSTRSSKAGGAPFLDWVLDRVIELHRLEPAPSRLVELVSRIETRWPKKSGSAPSRSTIGKCASPLWKKWRGGATADQLRREYRRWRASERERQAAKRSKRR